jgi:flagellar secretion chaperone FliS
MFAHHAMSRNTSSALAGVYRTVGVETGVNDASPHRLVAMLFEGFGDAVNQARSAMQRREIEGKCTAIGRAVRIVDEGLRANLDIAAGGKLAQDLSALYGYIALRLTQANLRNDPAALDECASLIEPVRSAWAAIDPNTPKEKVQ